MKETFVTYNPELRASVLEFLLKAYPDRNRKYFELWLSDLERGGCDYWEKTGIILVNNEIVGITMANPSLIKNFQGKELRVYCGANTIIKKEYRGKGLAKYLYELKKTPIEWCTPGITKMGLSSYNRYNIPYYSINPVNVYLAFNHCLAKKHKRVFEYPNRLIIGAGLEAILINTASDVEYPQSGRWTSDEYEYDRSKEYIENRFFLNYRAKEYAMFRIEKNKKQIGYFVVRKAFYKVNMLSLVDYRFDRSIASLKDVLKFVNKIAVMNNYGCVIVLTSDRLPYFMMFPFVLKTLKKLYCATSNSGIGSSKNLLITSADCDLDYVYYD